MWKVTVKVYARVGVGRKCIERVGGGGTKLPMGGVVSGWLLWARCRKVNDSRSKLGFSGVMGGSVTSLGVGWHFRWMGWHCDIRDTNKEDQGWVVR
eukprot:753012-Hanusia_phi.AAC.1